MSQTKEKRARMSAYFEEFHALMTDDGLLPAIDPDNDEVEAIRQFAFLSIASLSPLHRTMMLDMALSLDCEHLLASLDMVVAMGYTIGVLRTRAESRG